MQQMVRTRIAPSPTGFPHIGTFYQVLFDYAYAKQNNGSFIVRIEDTDRVRHVEGAEDIIFDCLDWFGITPDESPKHGGQYGPYRQSERLEIYRKYALELVEKGNAYYCFCTKERLEEMRTLQEKEKMTPMYDKKCLYLSKQEVKESLQTGVPYVIRMKIPENRTIIFNDLIIGSIEFDSNTIDNQVLLKADGFPTYHLGVVVDDHLMEVTHIFRGKEWIPSAPKHVLLYEYFGWEMPVHAHLPLILNDQGKGKLSKRFAHASVLFYKELGYLPEAVLNYLSNIVWNHPDGKEVYSLQEFTKLLDIKKITSQGARFDLPKLDWMNGEYIRMMTPLQLKERLVAFFGDKSLYTPELIEKTIPLIQERIKTLGEYREYCSFFVEAPKEYEEDTGGKKDLFNKTHNALSQVDEWKAEHIGVAMQETATALNMKNGPYFMMIRLAITGKKVTPPLNESMEILGKDECLNRLSFLF